MPASPDGLDADDDLLDGSSFDNDNADSVDVSDDARSVGHGSPLRATPALVMVASASAAQAALFPLDSYRQVVENLNRANWFMCVRARLGAREGGGGWRRAQCRAAAPISRPWTLS